MGWGDCGNDSKGRPIGYVFPATCDQAGCSKKIDRGVAYVCGDMHGEDEYSCEKYFCEEHQPGYIQDCRGHIMSVCSECYALAVEEWGEDEEEGMVIETSLDKVEGEE